MPGTRWKSFIRNSAFSGSSRARARGVAAGCALTFGMPRREAPTCDWQLGRSIVEKQREGLGSRAAFSFHRDLRNRDGFGRSGHGRTRLHC
jgi:hypothetical protein